MSGTPASNIRENRFRIRFADLHTHTYMYTHYCSFSTHNWRAGASLPSRPTGAIFLSIIYLYIYHPALMYAVMFYVILNKRKLH